MPPPAPALESVETLPGLLAAQAASRPRDTALRWKRLGIWREYGWAALADAVRDVALGFDELGIGAGDCVAIFAANDPRWLVADLAVQTVRGTCVGLPAVQDADELAANLATACPAMIVCGDQEQLDNVLADPRQIPAYSSLVVFD